MSTHTRRIERDYRGGYARTTDLDALFEAIKAKKILKNELRYFCAKLEYEEARGAVSIDQIINTPGKRRFTSGEQERCKLSLIQSLVKDPKERELTAKIPRKFLKVAAKGRLKMSEMITALFYFRWRMPQRRRRTSLLRGERYARFTYALVEQVTGLARATVCVALQMLRNNKLISIVWRPMYEIKKFGLLFVDGPALNLYYQKDERLRRRHPGFNLTKKRTHSTKNTNAIDRTLPKNSFSTKKEFQRSSVENKESKTNLFNRLKKRSREIRSKL